VVTVLTKSYNCQSC